MPDWHRGLCVITPLVTPASGIATRRAANATELCEALRQTTKERCAEAICEAVSRANMRFVPTKTPEQQSGLVLHRTRHLCIRQQTSVINAIRAHCAEFGIVAPVGRRGIEELLNVIANA